MADTPESVRHLAEHELAEIYTESRKAENTVSAAVDALSRYADLLEKTCEWTHDEDDDAYYTGCGNMYQFIDGGPKDNKQVFCGYCGGRIVEVGE